MQLVIPGDPIAQIRMRYSGRNGIGRIYDPREKDKKRLKDFISKANDNAPHLVHPTISFVFHMPIPKSIPKRMLPLYQSGFLKHEKKPDVDNLVKLYLDCLDPIVFDGDQKVTLGSCVKLYHAEPKTIIMLSETTEVLNPQEVDPLTALFLFGEEYGKYCSLEKASLLDCGILNQLELRQYVDMINLHQTIPSSDLK
jgi:Holliday junction resolvase RusA-like endonuclease